MKANFKLTVAKFACAVILLLNATGSFAESRHEAALKAHRQQQQIVKNEQLISERQSMQQQQQLEQQRLQNQHQAQQIKQWEYMYNRQVAGDVFDSLLIIGLIAR